MVFAQKKRARKSRSRRAREEMQSRSRRARERQYAYEPARRYGSDNSYSQLESYGTNFMRSMNERYAVQGSGRSAYARPYSAVRAREEAYSAQRRSRQDGRRGYDRREYEESYEEEWLEEQRRRRRRAKPARRPFRFTLSWRKVGNGCCDYNLLAVILFLICFGLIMLYSTTYYLSQVEHEGNSFYYLQKQGLISLGGLVLMYIISKIDYRFWKRLAGLGYLAAVVSVLLLLTPLGIESNGATRWIGVTETLSFQPAELCKIALIVFIPYAVVKIGRGVRSVKGTMFLLVLGGFVSGLILIISRNLSSAIILMGITVILVYIVHPKTWPFLAAGGAGLAAVWAFIHFVVSNMDTSENYRLRRIIGWLNPEEYASDFTYQTMQALYAIGSGGLFGKGLGNSAQKMILPEAQNDMIFSIICEELGIFGVAIVLLLFSILLYRLMFIARNAADLYGSLMVTGIFAHIAIQVVLNIAVVTNVIPNTGITLPFFSAGGTSSVFLMAEMGLALSVSRRIEWKKE